jgi:hypothetical protein
MTGDAELVRKEDSGWWLLFMAGGGTTPSLVSMLL